MFVPGGLPGEEAETRIRSVRPDYAVARITRLLRSSPARAVPPCPLYGRCGGCDLQHLDYPGQLAFKQEAVREALQRIGGIPAEVLPTVAGPDPYHYRRRVLMRVRREGRGIRLGLLQRSSSTVVGVRRCPVLHPLLEAFVGPLEARLNRLGVQDLKESGLHYSEEGAVLIVLEGPEVTDRLVHRLAGMLRQAGLPLRGLVGHGGRGTWAEGEPNVLERVAGLELRISDRTFRQTNAEVNAALVATVLEWSGECGAVLDLYSGAGNFALPLARRAPRVVAVEGNRWAEEDLRRNAERNGISTLTAIGEPVETALVEPRASNKNDLAGAFDLAVINPPRAGLSSAAIDAVGRLAPFRLIYVSCHPAALARDARSLKDRGYGLSRVQPFDMFPETHHVEVLAEFRR